MTAATIIPKRITLPFSQAPRHDPQPGEVYRYRGPHKVVETAEVLFVSADGQGIPHVCYRLTVTRADLVRMESRRTLTLSCFQQRFTESVAPVTAER